MANKHGDDCPLTADELPRFKKMLLAKQRKVLGNVMSMENETLRRARTDLSNLPYHMADLGSDNFELENTLGLVDSERRILEEIEDALIRIDDGTYGICEGNGEPIPKARLEAIPWARYCVKCASLAEMGLLGGEDIYDDSDY